MGGLLESILKGPDVDKLNLNFLWRRLRVHAKKGGYLDIVVRQSNHGSCLKAGNI